MQVLSQRNWREQEGIENGPRSDPSLCHWNKLPQEIKDQIFSYLKVVHQNTNTTLFYISHSPAILTRQIFFMERRRGEFDTDIFNAMRVNMDWYRQITRDVRYKNIYNFEGEWAIYKALEGLMTRPPKKRKTIEMKKSERFRMEEPETGMMKEPKLEPDETGRKRVLVVLMVLAYLVLGMLEDGLALLGL